MTPTLSPAERAAAQRAALPAIQAANAAGRLHAAEIVGDTALADALADIYREILRRRRAAQAASQPTTEETA